MDAIGVFDSGIGGLTVVSALRRRLPAESILYLGDTARLPYGSKSPETVIRYTRRNIEFLVERGVKAVVIACNTASALALDHLHLQAGLPLWGVIEPGARAAAAVSRGRVGVIATEATVRSDAYPQALRRLRPELAVVSRACPLLVPLVEEGWHDDEITARVAERYLAPLLAADIDTLVLGCTHYPLLKPVLSRIVGPGVTLVDSAEVVAEVVAEGLARAGLARESREPGTAAQHLCVTDAGASFQVVAGRILGDPDLPLEWVEVV
ncbi:MAG TPA: glutamate racemase [Thermoanaerobaculia bacterium]|nr:glutamate racemase [Thermoanaerobaculia bacterium]